MSGLEVLAVVGCVAAVVSAFHGAAELTEIIKDRKEKRTRRRRAETTEVVVPPELLRQSFIDGALQVDNSSIERRQRFGVVFERGDQTAKMELMQVVINLQGEVIRALQLARDVSYGVNTTTIYEYSITNRLDAIKSMDQLCQRIMQNQGPLMSLPPTDQVDRPVFASSPIETLGTSVEAINISGQPYRHPSDGSSHSWRGSISDLPAAISPPSEPKDSLATATRGWSAVPSRPVQRGTSNASVARSLLWLGRHVRRDDSDATTVRTQRIQEEGEHESVHAFPPQQRAFSVPHAGPANGDMMFSTGMFEHSSSLGSAMPPRSYSGATGTSSVQEPRDSIPSLGDRNSSVSSASSRNLTPSTSSTPSLLIDNGHGCTGSYPRWGGGVIRPDHDPSYGEDEGQLASLPRSLPDNSTWADPNLSLATTINRYPSLLTSPPLDPWAPHEKPSEANRFHGFCKGAWLAREGIPSGIRMTMKPYGMTAVLPYWQCRKCQFCTRAPSAKAKVPPTNINTSPSGIRYRWIFLARSHFKSKDMSGTHEGATFGCIFCVAEGNKDTLAYGKIDLLMAHIRSQHNGDTMPLEVKERTRCITGRVAEANEEWDINIPGERKKK